eukprot:Lankesteria_metandrocarpae@DN3585_c0_g1_i1.p1
MALSALCFIGKQNHPLYTKVLDVEDEFWMQCAFFCALDIVERRLADQKADASITYADSFLGYLTPAMYMGEKVMDFRIFGYVTSTGLKILCAFEDKLHVDDSRFLPEQQKLFTHLHQLYVDTICNPFLLGCLATENFKKRLNTVTNAYDSSVKPLLAGTTHSKR